LRFSSKEFNNKEDGFENNINMNYKGKNNRNGNLQM